jgi:hypothetical protein
MKAGNEQIKKVNKSLRRAVEKAGEIIELCHIVKQEVCLPGIASLFVMVLC